MNKIFENAYFGKPYKTRDGRKAIYTIMSCDSHWLAIQDTSFTWEYSDNGELVTRIDNAMDIVAEWPESINNEELDRLTPVDMTTEKENLYIRFGEIPKNGKSAIWKGDKCVGYENGVSVYEAHRNIDGRYAPVVPYPLTPTTLDDIVYHLMYFRGRKYLVRGDLLGSIGSNGEPLLENVEIITEL